MPKSPSLSENARVVLERRYLLRDEAGQVSETPAELLERVAEAVSKRGRTTHGPVRARFLDLMASGNFLPNSPTLMNAGRPEGQLSACFVLPVEDSLNSIFETLKHAALIHQSGGGTGFSFSRLRSRGSRVKTTQGVASGPVSFIRIFDAATEAIKQGGTRRGANMAVLSVEHPDIQEFIDSKRDGRSITNFNISVGATRGFMEAVERGDARERALFSRMCHAAWECGDPGLVFLDRINLLNPTPREGDMESTNPCGEQPLLPYESCNLGSLNLGNFVEQGAIQWKPLRQAIWDAVLFLDTVIDINAYPIDACRRITLKNRKIGLGVMGFADLLLFLGLRYDSPRAREMGEQLMAFIDREGKRASADLARRYGAFPNWKGSLWEKLGYPKLRNATVSTVAPTGTISLIAGCSSGIEPIFSGVLARNVLDGDRLVEVHPPLKRVFAERGLTLSARPTEQDIEKSLQDVWSPARRVSVAGHVGMQAVFQRHSDSAVSKTINLPQSATPTEVEEAYLLAYRSGCKGITVYRDQSRSTQVLEPADLCPSC